MDDKDLNARFDRVEEFLLYNKGMWAATHPMITPEYVAPPPPFSGSGTGVGKSASQIIDWFRQYDAANPKASWEQREAGLQLFLKGE